jgi:hypothetical protein
MRDSLINHVSIIIGINIIYAISSILKLIII